MQQKTNQNISFLTTKFILVDIVGDILYWPVWWYSRGIKKLAVYIYSEIINYQDRVGLKLWLASLFKPMYGQSDWQGRLISFFMRFVILIYKLLKFVIWVILMVAFLVIWCLVLPFAIFQILKNFYNFFL